MFRLSDQALGRFAARRAKTRRKAYFFAIVGNSILRASSKRKVESMLNSISASGTMLKSKDDIGSGTCDGLGQQRPCNIGFSLSSPRKDSQEDVGDSVSPLQLGEAPTLCVVCLEKVDHSCCPYLDRIPAAALDHVGSGYDKLCITCNCFMDDHKGKLRRGCHWRAVSKSCGQCGTEGEHWGYECKKPMIFFHEDDSSWILDNEAEAKAITAYDKKLHLDKLKSDLGKLKSDLDKLKEEKDDTQIIYL